MENKLYKVIQYETLDSTNEECKRKVRGGKLEALDVIWANEQLKGKGQNGKMWSSIKGLNLTISFPVFLVFPPLFQGVFNMAIANAVRLTVEKFVGQQVDLKWPNDVFVNHKKIAGILIENNIHKEKIVQSIIGIGLNINQAKFDESYGKATSLLLETGRNFFREEVLDVLMKNVQTELLAFSTRSFDKISQNYQANLYGRNITLEMSENGEIKEGEIKRVNEQGKLVVSFKNGSFAYAHGSIQVNYEALRRHRK